MYISHVFGVCVSWYRAESYKHYRTSSIVPMSPSSPIRNLPHLNLSRSLLSPPLPPSHHRRYPTGAIVALALAEGAALTVAVALALALELASASFPIPSSTPLFSRQITAMTPPAMTMKKRIQKSQQMRVRRFFFDCWRASQDSLWGRRCVSAREGMRWCGGPTCASSLPAARSPRRGGRRRRSASRRRDPARRPLLRDVVFVGAPRVVLRLRRRCG